MQQIRTEDVLDVIRKGSLVFVLGLGCTALAGLESGCDDKPKTSTAPPTLTNINRENLVRNPDGEDDDFEDDDFADERRSRVRSNTDDSVNLSRFRPAGRKRKTRPHEHEIKKAPTINGHPEGPKAEVFNAIINSAFPRVGRCFANQASKLRPGRNALRVDLTVANDGSVKSATVSAGISNSAVRSCVRSVVKNLKFPAFKGSEVKQSVPFTYVSK